MKSGIKIVLSFILFIVNKTEPKFKSQQVVFKNERRGN